MLTRRWFLGAVVVAAALFPTLVQAQVKIDEKLPSYTPAGGVSGSIKSVGSDTMNNLMTLWAEGFRKHYPNVQIEIEGKGSGTAPTALIGGTATFGPMSRPMKSKEQDEFEKAFGYKCTMIGTSIDMLAVFTNKDNPLEGLSMQQVDAIFSKGRKGGFADDITRWGQLGLKGDFANAPIELYGRNSASGTYGFFQEHALFKGDYKDSVKEQPGSSSVVQGVATSKFAIGYSGIGYKTADVKALSLSAETGGQLVPATPEYAYTGEYPLARYLYLGVNFKPGSQLEPLRAEFLKYIFSKEGQEVVVKDGYFPVTADIAKEMLTKVGIK